jgi:peptidyl-prolyl cis-trans isomerase D
LHKLLANSAYLPYLGPEPKIVGYTFYDGFKPNTVSPPIQGQDGLFFISLTARNEAPAAPADPMMISQQAMMMQMQVKNSISGGLMDLLRKKAEIKYNGALLY